MKQDILQKTKELISLFREQQIDGELYEQLQTLENIILENEEKAFTFVQPFIDTLFDQAKKILSTGKSTDEVDSLIRQFEERGIQDDIYDELKVLKIALSTKALSANKDSKKVLNILASDLIQDANKRLAE